MQSTSHLHAALVHVYSGPSCLYVSTDRAVYRNFAKGGGGEFGVWTKEGGGTPGGSSVVSCEVLHSRGGENDTRGGECPPLPPLNTALTDIA